MVCFCFFLFDASHLLKALIKNEENKQAFAQL